jgi:hypothetical protein
MCQSPYTMQWNQTKSHCPNLVDTMDHIHRSDKGIHVNIRWGKSYKRTWSSLAHVWSSWYLEYYVAGKQQLLFQNNAKINSSNGSNTSTINRNHRHKNYRRLQQQQQQQQQRQVIPRLMIRFEDMLFYPERVVDEIRECIGAEWKNSNSGIATSSSASSDDTTTDDDNNNDSSNTDKNKNKNNNSALFYERIKQHFVYRAEPSKTHTYFERFKTYQSSMVSAIIKYGSEGMYRTRRTRNMTQADLAFARNYLDQTLLNVFHYTHPSLIE